MPRFYRTAKPRSLSTLTARAALFVLAFGISSAQAQYISFDGPNAGTQSGQGTFPVAITRDGFIGLTVVDNSFISHAYVRMPKGNYTAVVPPNSLATYLAGLNSGRQVAGSFVDTSHQTHGFFRDANGQFTQLDAPNSNGSTNVAGLNAVGQVVGNFFATGGVQESFFWDPKNPSEYVVITVPGSSFTVTMGINTGGEITGLYGDSSGQHGFVRAANGSFTSFDFGSTANFGGPLLINTRGQVAGGYSDQGIDSGFLREPLGQIIVWGSGSHTGPQPEGMNDLGVIVGFEFGEGGNNVAFERDTAGNITFLNIPFSNTASSANAINRGGHITGTYTDSAGVNHGWVN
jgi:hypothetical protein